MKAHSTYRLIATGLLTLGLMIHGAASAQGRQVTDAMNRTVVLPQQPLRIVALSELDLDALLSLGVKPVGATRGRGQDGMPRYLGPAAASVPSAGKFAAPVLDILVGMQPDLILAGGMADAQLISQLARIAPTVVTYQPGEHWQVALRRVAGATGRTTQADAFLSAYREQAGALRAKLGGGATVSVVRWSPQGPAYMLKDAFASLVLADVALRRPATQQQPGVAHSPALSLEALDRIDADWLFIGTLSANGPASDSLAAAHAAPGFRQLGAVKAGRMRVVDGSLWSGPGGPLAARAILADLEKAMAAP